MTAVVVDTRDAIARFQAGDRAAYADLYTAYRGMVFGYALSRTGHPQLAEDLTHDVFVKALRRLDGWQDQGKDPGAWLTTITRRLILDHYKRHETRRASSVFLHDVDGEHGGWDEFLDAGADPEGEVLDRHRDAAVREAVGRLGTADQREVILNRFARKLSIAETARAMGRTEPVVKALQYRALRSMRRHFDGRSWL